MRWWKQQDSARLWISAITILEIRFGFETMPAGRRRQATEHWLNSVVLTGFGGRILPVDEAVADLLRAFDCSS